MKSVYLPGDIPRILRTLPSPARFSSATRSQIASNLRAPTRFNNHTIARPWERGFLSFPLLIPNPCLRRSSRAAAPLHRCLWHPHPSTSASRSWTTPTSHNAPAILVSEAAPKSLRILWQGQIPISAHAIVQRATSSSATTPTTGPNSSLCQIVATSTKMTTLSVAVCGFVPFWNTTSGVIGKEDIGIILK